MRTNMNNELNRTSILVAACIALATPLAAQTPVATKAEPVLMAAAFVPNKTSESAAKPIADRPLSAETMKPEPPQAPLPKLLFPAAVSASSAAGAVAVKSTPTIVVVPEPAAPTSRQFGPVKVEPGAISYQTAMGTNIDALQRFGAAPGVTRLTFGR
jgi:hypothetical protein